MFPVAGSYAMAAALGAFGLVGGVCWVQFVPSHVHVSVIRVMLPKPPHRTVFPVAGSYAITASWRAEGLVAGLCWVQAVPSQVHVSEKWLRLTSAPPKSTMLPVAGSYAITAPQRAAGLVGGDCRSQIAVAPGIGPQLHVSARSLPPE